MQTIVPTTPLSLKSKVFRGLADSSRLSVLESLVAGARCVSDIVALTGLSQPSVSNHLACLRECGLVEREQRGRFAYYSLADPGVRVVLREVERLVGCAASRIDACPNYSEESLER